MNSFLTIKIFRIFNFSIFACKFSALKRRHILCFFGIILFNLCQLDGLAAENLSDSAGKILFRENCASCHEIGRVLTGPDLKGISERRTKDWLIRFIRNSAEMIEANDPQAVRIFREFKEVNMPATSLSDSEIVLIINYIENYIPVAEKALTRKSPSTQQRGVKIPLLLLLSASLFLMFFLLFLVLILCRSRAGKDIPLLPAFVRFLNMIPLSFYVTLLVLLVTIMLVSANNYYRKLYILKQFSATRTTIDFSHQQHYEDYQINCVYCHVSSLSMKTANLPTATHCMKCHNYIRKGEKTGEKEISKLLKLVEKNMDIEWETGYRLSRHVHFDHALHTISGGFECIDCHTDPADVRIQKGDFTMKWCINCHKKNNYSAENNIPGIKAGQQVRTDCILCHY